MKAPILPCAILFLVCQLWGGPATGQTPHSAPPMLEPPTVQEDGLSRLRVGWTPTENVVPPVTGYRVQYREAGEDDWSDVPGDVTPAGVEIDDLSADTRYQVRVRAENAAGEGAWSNPAEGYTALWASILTAGEIGSSSAHLSSNSSDGEDDNLYSGGYLGYQLRKSTKWTSESFGRLNSFGNLDPASFSYDGITYEIFILGWYRARRSGGLPAHSSSLELYVVQHQMPDNWVLRVQQTRFPFGDAYRVTFPSYGEYGKAEKYIWFDPGFDLELSGEYDVTIYRSISSDPPAATEQLQVENVEAPLTASFASIPASHDGSSVFTVELHFSDEPILSFRDFTNGLITVSGATVRNARRLKLGNNAGWTIEIEPAGTADVVIDVPANRDCAAAITICTADGRKLSQTASVSIPGPDATPSPPEITSGTAFDVAEGSTAIAALTATDADTDAAELVWSISGGADRGHFTLSTAGVLAFSLAKDFESPDDADTDGVYRVAVEVSDGDGSDTAELTVRLLNRNESPVADAGADQAGIEPGASVVLSGGGSDQDANDTQTFAWTQTNGRTVELTDADKATAGFTAPTGLSADATLTFSLRVTDAAGLTDEDSVSVTVRGSPTLTAAFSNAPASHNGAARFTVELRFSEEVLASYLWFAESVFEMTGGSVSGARRLTQGSNIGWLITLVPGGDADVVLTLPANRDCSETGAICTVDGRTMVQAVQLTVPGPAPAEPPEIIGPTGFTVVEGDTTVATLTASDPDTDLADLTWSIPAGAGGGADAGRFTLTGAGALAFADAKDFEVPDDADANGRYQVIVEVSDGALSATADLTVTLENRNEAPTADAGADRLDVEHGATVTLSGSGSDPDAGDVLAYVWTQSSGAAVSLINAQTASAKFTAPTGLSADATLTFTLTVIDADGLEGRDAVSVTVRASDEELSDDATLTALSLSGIDIGHFSPATTSYSARVGNDVSQTTVSATPNHAAAQVRIADSDGSVAGTRRVITLDEGENAIAVTVTAEDGTSRTYTVTVTRAGASDAEAVEGGLRLVNGSGPHEGRVEIYHDERWGTVCDDYWTPEDAAVVCRQLGYDGAAQALRRAKYGEGEDPIWMDNVQCEGDEARLADCPFRGWGVHNCKHREDAGVICGGSPASTALVGAHLAGDRLTLQYAGRLNPGPAPAPDDFVVLASSNEDLAAVPVRGVEIRDSTVELGLARRVARSEDVTLSYLAAPMNPIEDDSGNPAPSLRGVAVSHLDTPGSRSDVARVPELAAPEASETDAPASGIELLDAAQRGAIKLEQLDLSDQGLTDLTPFWGLSDLERLGLRDNAVSDLTALSGLTDLNCLDLSHNQITDIWPLASLVHLHCLDLSHNGIQDVTALAGLINLRRLDLTNNRISDLSALAALERLEVVRLDGNAIEDIWAISQLRASANLGLSRNRIADIGLLAGTGSLQRLDISHNRIADLVAIGRLPSLVWLRLDGNPAANPHTLIGSTHLRQVQVDARSSRANIWLSTHGVHMPDRPLPGR